MPNSLRTKISKLRYKGQISEDEYKELINKLDGHDTEQLKWWLEYLNRVTDILENEIAETKVKIEKMKELQKSNGSNY